MSCLRFHVTVVWLPLLLGCFFTLCESQGSSNHVFSNSQQTYSGSSNESGKSALSQPGVVVGIIVGVAGVLVVVGVSILLCRLFCCKESTACCCCCKQEERYLEAGTVPIKVPSEEGTPDNNLTRTRQPPQNNTRKTSDSSPNPPQYDDILVPDWKLDMTKNKLPKTASDGEERGSQDSIHDAVPPRRSENSPTVPADSDETANNLSSGAAKRKKPTPTRRKLTYEGAENPDLTQDSADFASSEQHRRPKKHDRREFPVTGHKHRKENVKTPQHEDATVERSTDEMTSGREFPLLEYEPGARKARNFSYNPSYADVSRETWEGYGDQGEEFRPVEFDHQHQYLPAASYYPDHSSSRVRGEDRRPWPEHRELFAPPAPAPIANSSNPPHHNVPYISGRVNPAFNQETTETEV